MGPGCKSAVLVEPLHPHSHTLLWLQVWRNSSLRCINRLRYESVCHLHTPWSTQTKNLQKKDAFEFKKQKATVVGVTCCGCCRRLGVQHTHTFFSSHKQHILHLKCNRGTKKLCSKLRAVSGKPTVQRKQGLSGPQHSNRAQKAVNEEPNTELVLEPSALLKTRAKAVRFSAS
jgi:hypothetical protein